MTAPSPTSVLLAAEPLPSADAVAGAAALEAAFATHRAALTGHCYRMLGSLCDAEDAVQDTLLRAWRARDGFGGRASVRTWLTAIATRVCLDALTRRGRRQRLRPTDLGEPTPVRDGLALEQRPPEDWVEPIPDAAALPADGDPAEQAVLRESIRLAFVAALQYLPPRQRAALLLTQVLGWPAAEAAETLGMTLPALNSALQRARATLQTRNPAVVPRALPAAQAALLERYVAAFEAYDIAALTTLLHEEATMSMPPFALWLRGRDEVARWMTTYGAGCTGSRLVPVAPSCGGRPTFAQYKAGGAEAWGLVVLDVVPDGAGGARVAGLAYFLDVATLFPRFGLPMRLDA